MNLGGKSMLRPVNGGCNPRKFLGAKTGRIDYVPAMGHTE